MLRPSTWVELCTLTFFTNGCWLTHVGYQPGRANTGEKSTDLCITVDRCHHAIWLAVLRSSYCRQWYFELLLSVYWGASPICQALLAPAIIICFLTFLDRCYNAIWQAVLVLRSSYCQQGYLELLLSVYWGASPICQALPAPAIMYVCIYFYPSTYEEYTIHFCMMA